MLELPFRRIRLGRVVGHGQTNAASDVAQIEGALDHLGRLPKGDDSGRMRPALEHALQLTQRRFGLKSDGQARWNKAL